MGHPQERKEDTAHRAVAHATADDTPAANGAASVTVVTPEAEDLPEGPVRVPWLKYQDAPVRSGPKRQAVSEEEVEPVNEEEVERVIEEEVQRASTDELRTPERSPAPASEEYEPLLTEEELRALLGDDFGRGTMEGNGERS